MMPEATARRVARWGVRIIALLVGGMMVNIAIAWACIAWGRVDRQATSSLSINDGAVQGTAGAINPDLMPRVAARGVPRLGSVVEHRFAGFGLLAESAHVFDFSDPSLRSAGSEFSLYACAAGWPCLSLSCQAVNSDWSFGLPLPQWSGSSSFRRDGSMLKVFGKRPPLPWRPRVLGFAINTFSYGAVVHALLDARRAARRILRRSRGQCIECGYDRTGLARGAICPECGKLS